MKILIVHNSYQQYGGEDTVCRSEVELLCANGHQVYVHCISNDVVHGVWARVKAALGVVFSLPAYVEMRNLIQQYSPDIVHVHNFFPLLSPSIFYACCHKGVPSVLTLHNYRIMCPTAILMFKGVVCERSLYEGPWWAVSKKVYRGSWIGTFVLALMIDVHRRLGTWRSVVSRFITLTDFSRQKYITWGIPSARIDIKPNFLNDPVSIKTFLPEAEDLPNDFVLYVGRLSVEKGIALLQSAWQQLNMPLFVVGDGPEMHLLHKQPGIYVLGKRPYQEVLEIMAKCRFVVMPSLCYEGFPMTLLESMALAKPAIVSHLGALQEIVQDGVTGLHVEVGDVGALVSAVNRLFYDDSLCRQLGDQARVEYQEKYSADVNYQQLMAIYDDVVQCNFDWRR